MYNDFRIERSPKMGFFGVILGVGAKIFSGKVHSSSELRVFRHIWSTNSVYVDTSKGENVQEILGTIGPFWAKLGLRRVPRSPSFFVW